MKREVAAEIVAGVGAAESVGAEHHVATRHEGAYLFRKGANVIAGRDHRALGVG